MFLFKPGNFPGPVFAPDFVAFTLDAPEVLTVDDPEEGFWFVFIQGFEFNTPTDNWRLHVTLDGVPLEPEP